MTELPDTIDKEPIQETRATSLRSAPIQEIKQQARDIQDLLEELMQSGEHYGTFFEGQDKPTLLQPGAEKLCSAFGMTPRYEVETFPIDLEGVPAGHREVRTTCSLYTRGDQTFLGQGVGVCSTLEPKYRYRGGKEEEITEVGIPKSFWESGDNNGERDFDILREALSRAGADVPTDAKLNTEKVEGNWRIAYSVGTDEKVENPDPAAEWNTVAKMSKKRALVDAVKTATAASDIFTQDVEDMPHLHEQEQRQHPDARVKNHQGDEKTDPRAHSGRPPRGQKRSGEQADPDSDPRQDPYEKGRRNLRARLGEVEEDPNKDIEEAIGAALSFIANWEPQEWKRGAEIIRQFVPDDAEIKVPETPPSVE